jgi:hypothetical protein
VAELVVLGDVVEGREVTGEPSVAEVACVVHHVHSQLVLHLDQLVGSGEPEQHECTLNTHENYEQSIVKSDGA